MFTSPHGQNGRHFTDDVFKCIFVNEKFCILIKTWLKFVPNGPININPALVEIMAWRRIGDKPLSEAMLTWFTDAYMRTLGARWVNQQVDFHVDLFWWYIPREIIETLKCFLNTNKWAPIIDTVSGMETGVQPTLLKPKFGNLNENYIKSVRLALFKIVEKSELFHLIAVLLCS